MVSFGLAVTLPFYDLHSCSQGTIETGTHTDDPRESTQLGVFSLRNVLLYVYYKLCLNFPGWVLERIRSWSGSLWVITDAKTATLKSKICRKEPLTADRYPHQSATRRLGIVCSQWTLEQDVRLSDPDRQPTTRRCLPHMGWLHGPIYTYRSMVTRPQRAQVLFTDESTPCMVADNRRLRVWRLPWDRFVNEAVAGNLSWFRWDENEPQDLSVGAWQSHCWSLLGRHLQIHAVLHVSSLEAKQDSAGPYQRTDRRFWAVTYRRLECNLSQSEKIAILGRKNSWSHFPHKLIEA